MAQRRHGAGAGKGQDGKGQGGRFQAGPRADQASVSGGLSLASQESDEIRAKIRKTELDAARNPDLDITPLGRRMMIAGRSGTPWHGGKFGPPPEPGINTDTSAADALPSAIRRQPTRRPSPSSWQDGGHFEPPPEPGINTDTTRGSSRSTMLAPTKLSGAVNAQQPRLLMPDYEAHIRYRDYLPKYADPPEGWDGYGDESLEATREESRAANAFVRENFASAHERFKASGVDGNDVMAGADWAYSDPFFRPYVQAHTGFRDAKDYKEVLQVSHSERLSLQQSLVNGTKGLAVDRVATKRLYDLIQ